MAATIREQVVAAVRSGIEDAAIAGLTVHRNVDRAFSLDELPAVVVHDGPHEKTESFTGTASFRMTVGLELFVSSDSPGTTLNALYGDLVAALYADRSLGGLVNDLHELALADIDLLEGARQARLMTAMLEIEVLFETDEADRTAHLA